MSESNTFPHTTVLKEVEAVNSVLAEIQKNLPKGSFRILRVEINDAAIPWVTEELYRRQGMIGTLEEFTDDFKRHLENGQHFDIFGWKYFPDRGQGQVGVILSPKEETFYFGIIPDESGKRILRYRYIAYK
ncbi:MAG: hypothetical protein KF843_11920 [Flavobacteriales bacterium]|nr:hypothetical protein [Flavobacteriales bacterium]